MQYGFSVVYELDHLCELVSEKVVKPVHRAKSILRFSSQKKWAESNGSFFFQDLELAFIDGVKYKQLSKMFIVLPLNLAS